MKCIIIIILITLLKDTKIYLIFNMIQEHKMSMEMKYIKQRLKDIMNI